MSLSKEIIELISKVSGCLHLANLGLDDEDVLELAKILEKRPDITSLD